MIKTWFEDFMGKSFKDKLFIVLPYMIGMFSLARIAELYRLCGGDLYKFVKNITYLYRVFPPHFVFRDILIGVLGGGVIVWYIRWANRMHKKNTRFGEEYGSARWSA